MTERSILLPSSIAVRWVPRRKAQVAHAIRTGILTLEEAAARYSLSAQEIQSWIDLVARHGTAGLRATKMQAYRPIDVRGVV